jgi:hypothetical protein
VDIVVSPKEEGEGEEEEQKILVTDKLRFFQEKILICK